MRPVLHPYLSLYCVFFLFVAFSCSKENRGDCFHGNGEDISETRLPGVFTEVEVYDKISLTVHAGASHSVVVRAGKNVIKNIKTEVREGRLHVDNRNTCNFVRGYKRGVSVEVYVPYLKFLKNSGVGPATIGSDRIQDTLVVRAENSGDIMIGGDYSEIRTSSHGNGDIYLQGRSKRLFVYTYGTNYVHAEKIILKEYAFIHSITLGDCIVNADSLNRLECNIQGQGNVYYLGEPATLVDYSDKARYSGRLYKK